MLSNHRKDNSLPDLVETFFESYWTTLVRLVNGRVTKVCGMTGYVTGQHDPLLNGVIGSRSQATDASICKIVDFFVKRSLPMSWRLFSPDPDCQAFSALTNRGMILAERAAGMSVDLDGMRAVPRSSNLEIRRVRTLADLARWVDVLALSFPLSKTLAQCILQAESRRLRDGDRMWTNYLGLVDHEPVSTLSLRVVDGVGALFNAGTMPGRASSGCGPSHLMRVADDAQYLGIRRIVLHACPNVGRLCRRLGFRRHGMIDTYVATPEWLLEFGRIKGAIGQFTAADND